MKFHQFFIINLVLCLLNLNYIGAQGRFFRIRLPFNWFGSRNVIARESAAVNELNSLRNEINAGQRTVSTANQNSAIVARIPTSNLQNNQRREFLRARNAPGRILPRITQKNVIAAKNAALQAGIVISAIGASSIIIEKMKKMNLL